MDYTTSKDIGTLLESLQHERDFAQERIDAIGLYQRALAAYKESNSTSPEIHHRVWTCFGDIEGKMQQAFEVRDYSLATKVELVKLPYLKQFEISGEAWEISFSCGFIPDEKGDSHPILCRTENSYEDKYHLFRGVGLQKRKDLCALSVGYPWRVEHKDTLEVCNYYQKLGVKGEVLLNLLPLLDTVNAVPYETLLNEFRAMIRERERRIDDILDRVGERIAN